MISRCPDPNAELPADELAKAVCACRKQDRRLDMYYKFASPAARKFVELGFYSNYFGERTDPALYARCRDAIAPTLTESDLRYLLRFESDPGTKNYLNGLLAKSLTPQPRPVPSPRPAPATKRRVSGKRKEKKSRLARPRPSGQRASGDDFLLKALTVLAIACLIIVIGAIHACVNDARDAKVHRQLAMPRENRVSQPTAKQPKPPPKRRTPSRTTAGNAPQDLPVETPTKAEVPSQSLSATESSGTNDVPTTSETRTTARRVVFTDASRISTRSDGTIEVPRTFSYAGAGLKRPFWIYDPQLEKSGRIEHEARAEKNARDKWKALYDEASRQEATAASRGPCP